MFLVGLFGLGFGFVFFVFLTQEKMEVGISHTDKSSLPV